MKYVVEITPELAEEINRQVRSGKYKSPQDFMLAAIQNQTYLESVEAGGVSADTSLHSSISLESPLTPVNTKVSGARLLLQPYEKRVRTVPVRDRPRPDHLSGLSNRLFPVKTAVRVAGNLVDESGSEYIVLDHLREKAAEVARQLGKEIQRKDKTMGRKRGNIIYAGLPVGSEDKSKSRFMDQFVGFIGKNRVEGAAATLKFLEIVEGGKNSPLVGVTDFGLKFGLISNPIIDRQDYSTPFSDEEVDFLLEHIASQLPEEARLMKLVLELIHEGIDTPDQLTERIQGYNPEWSINVVVLERVGLISRASELGLVKREKDGVKVTYLLTDRGRKYLQNIDGHGDPASVRVRAMIKEM